MDLSKILFITGHPGLFKLVGKMKGGVLVESMTDGKRMPAYANQKILALDDVSIYTEADDVRLTVIFDSLIDKTGGKPVIDPKAASTEELRALLATVLPNFDRDRVYASDIKRLIQWYNQLAEKGLAVKDVAKEEDAKEGKKPAAKAKSDDISPVKTATPKAKVPTSKAKAPVATQRKSGKA